jgi:hypothetical protein
MRPTDLLSITIICCGAARLWESRVVVVGGSVAGIADSSESLLREGGLQCRKTAGYAHFVSDWRTGFARPS